MAAHAPIAIDIEIDTDADTGASEPTGMPWYVVQCNPLKEEEAASALRGYLGLNVYLPEAVRRVHGVRRPRPFFPGYIFAQADLGETKLSGINSTPFVVRLLDFGGGPQKVDEAVVRAIREQVDAINTQGGVLSHSFKEGDSVRVTSGAFRGIEAVFMGPMTPSERVKVLLHFLGGLREVNVEVDTLEKSGAPTRGSAHRERRTRGGGREIGRESAAAKGENR